MAFKFKLESLLKHRKHLEDEAQKVYIRAKGQVDDKLEQIQECYKKVEESRLLMESEIQSGSFHSQRGEGLELFIQGSNKLVDIYRLEARELMTLAEKAYDDLLEKRLEYKTLEKLKEKKHKEYMYNKKKKEKKEIEDIVNMRHGRNK